MFELFKKSKKVDMNIYSPVDGYCEAITKCSDGVFSSKMMGDGFLIQPTKNIIKSTCDGEIQMIFPSKHAVGIKMKDGLEVMIHIGIDTVKLNGQGFKQLIKPNTKVQIGTPLIELDMDYLQSQNIDLSVIVVMSNEVNGSYQIENLNKKVEAGMRIIKRE